MGIDYTSFAFPKGTKKSKKHKQTKATEIPKKIKEAVWKRDKHRCICCHKLVPVECGNAHLIKRSQRWFRNRRKYSYIMPRMPFRRRFRFKY